MANETLTVLRLVQHRADGSIAFDNGADMPGHSNGTYVYRVEAPFNFTEYTCYANFGLPDGSTERVDLDKGLTNVTVEIDGLEQTYYRYENVISDSITGIASNNSATPINVTTFFTLKSDDSIVPPMNLVTISVLASNKQDRRGLAPDDKSELEGNIAVKRDRNPSALSTQEVPIPDDYEYTVFDPNTQTEKKFTQVTLTETVQARADLLPSYPTRADSGIVAQNRSVGFEGNHLRRALSVEESIYDKVTPFEYIIPNVPLTDTTVTSAIFDVSDFPTGIYTTATITSYLYSKKVGGNFIFRNDYYKLDSLGNETLIEQGIEQLITTDTYNQVQIRDTITTQFEIEPGDTVITYTTIRAENATTVTAYAQIMGTPPTSYDVFGLEAGSVSSNKMNKILGGVVDNIAKIKEDGDLEDAGIGVSDLALLSAIQTFLQKITFNDDVDILQDLTVGGESTFSGKVTINGDFEVTTPGTQSIINVTDHQVEDLFPRFARNNPSDNVDLGIEWDLGIDGILELRYKGSGDKKLRFGIVGNQKVIAFIEETPTDGDILVYNVSNGLIESKTSTEIKTLLSLENVTNKDEKDLAISDATQLALDDLDTRKIEGIDYYNQGTFIGKAKEADYIGGATVILSTADRVVLDITGAGIGEGVIDVGQTEGIAIPSVPTLQTLIAFNTKTPSTDDTIFEIFDNADVPSNLIRVKKTASVELGEPLIYVFELIGTAVNNDTASAHNLTFTFEKDSIIIGSQVVTISAAAPTTPTPTPGTNNFTETVYVFTNPVQADEDIQIYVTSDSVLVDLNKINYNIEPRFVSGEALTEVMRTGVFATSGTTKVDKALTTDGVMRFDTTNPQDADLVTNDIVDLEIGRVYKLELQPTLTGANMTWTKDNGANTYDIFETDGITNAIGTDYITLDELEVLFDGTKLIVASTAKNIAYDNVTSGLTSRQVQSAIDEQKVFIEEELALGGETNYTIQSSSYQDGDAVVLYLDGVLQKENSQYTFVSATGVFTFLDFSLDTDEQIRVEFSRTGSGGGVFFSSEVELDLTGSDFDLGASQNKIIKTDNTVVLDITIAKFDFFALNDLIGTIPIGYRPKVDIPLGVADSFKKFTGIKIYTTGEIRVESLLIPTGKFAMSIQTKYTI